jgi:hypothetical protein
MCTVSWLHEPGEYQLFCNRDEKLTRRQALPPRLLFSESTACIAPIDSDHGGTWIGVNEYGIALCLLNGAAARGPLSRGLIIPRVIGASTGREAARRLASMNLPQFSPFTLVILEPDREATVIVWDAKNLRTVPDAESCMPLVSSSVNLETVRRHRRREFDRRVRIAGSVSAALLHDFHHWHDGAMSPCMHRADAQTVSFTRLRVSHTSVQLTYTAGAPCQAGPTLSVRTRSQCLPRRQAGGYMLQVPPEHFFVRSPIRP